MPRLYTVKNYQPQMSYHVFNRGANQQNIFIDKNDYWVFRRYARSLEENSSELFIKTFSLLPNHLHFRLYQETETAITHFMKSLCIKYVLYLNKKYSRSGQLFESQFKAIAAKTEADIERIDEYILKNPINKGFTNWPHVGRNI